MTARRLNRIAAASVFSVVSAIAGAELYDVRIYGAPVGCDWMMVSGAADDVNSHRFTMTGWVMPTGASEPQAGYLTHYGFRNLNPAGWASSQIFDSWANTYHVGSGMSSPSGPRHALYWIGAGPAVDLHPGGAGYVSSEAFGGNGQLQVGYVEGSFFCTSCGLNHGRHAVSWNRTSNSIQRLHSTNHTATRALATNGVQAAGEGFEVGSGEMHALYWPGPNSMAVDLHPAGYNESSASVVVGNLQAGYVRGAPTGSFKHAAIWTGNSAVTDINPSSTFFESWVTGMKDGFYIANGRAGTTPNRTQAFALWLHNGQWINLHSRLPYPYILWNSFAEDINQWGDVTGYIEKDGNRKPVIWLRH